MAKTSCIIKDEAIHPYYLIQDDDNFALHREIPSGYQTQAKSYYTSLSSALKKIIKIKTKESLSGKEVTIKEYIEQYQKIGKEITNSLKNLIEGDD